MKLERVYPLCEEFEEEKKDGGAIDTTNSTSTTTVTTKRGGFDPPKLEMITDKDVRDNYLTAVKDLYGGEKTKEDYEQYFPDESQYQTWLTGQFDKWRADADAEKERALNQNKGKRLGADLGNFLRSITDHIQSASGAPVLPSNVQEQYDKLDTEHKAVYDTYWAKQDAIRQQQMASQDAKIQRDYSKASAVANLLESQRQLFGNTTVNAITGSAKNSIAIYNAQQKAYSQEMNRASAFQRAKLASDARERMFMLKGQKSYRLSFPDYGGGDEDAFFVISGDDTTFVSTVIGYIKSIMARNPDTYEGFDTSNTFSQLDGDVQRGDLRNAPDLLGQLYGMLTNEDQQTVRSIITASYNNLYGDITNPQSANPQSTNPQSTNPQRPYEGGGEADEM